MKRLVKKLLNNTLLCRIYNIVLGFNKIRGRKNNIIDIKKAILNRTRITIKGCNNEIHIGNMSWLKNCTINIYGDNNKLFIGSENIFENNNLWLEDNDNTIAIGNHNRFFNQVHLAALEGKSIIIGDDGLYAPNVQCRTSDSHSILDANQVRINKAQDIRLGNHVWLGEGAVILKGCDIKDGCVIGIHSVASKLVTEENSVYVGSPARQVSKDIHWDSKRI